MRAWRLVLLAIVVGVVLVLYVTGPAWKESTACSPPSTSQLRPAGHGYGTQGGGCSTFRQRTNAWERFKGSITGDP